MADRRRSFLLVGLTGGIASGKSAVAGMFRELGVPVVDADRIVHGLLGEGGQAVEPILRAFGTGLASSGGGVDREELGRIVFADSDARRRLEEIVHPLVESESERLITSSAEGGSEIVVYDAPLLIETGRHERVDRLIVVTVDPDVQLERLMSRDGTSPDDAGARIRSQLPLSEKEEAADYVIENSGSWRDTRTSVSELHRLLLEDLRALRAGEDLPRRST